MVLRVTALGILVAACGSVSEHNPDAPRGGDAGFDASSDPPGTLRWARSLSAAAPAGIVEGSAGVVVSGYITAPADLGGTVLTPVGATDTVIASYAIADAAHVYSTRYGGAGSEYGFLDTLETTGSPVIAGVAYGSALSNQYDVGAGPVTAGGGPGSDGYVGRYGLDGTAAWVVRTVGPGEDKLLDTAPGPSSIFTIGWYETSTTFDTTPFTSAGGRDILFARLNSFTGAVQTVRSFGSAGRDEASSVAVLGGDVVAVGFFDGTLTFGSTTALTSVGGLDMWVARMSADGTPVWAVRFGGTAEDRSGSVVTDAGGDIYVSGTFTGQIAFGAVNLVSQGMVDIFLVKLSGSDGSVMWANSIGSPGVDNTGDLAVDPRTGAILMASTVAGLTVPDTGDDEGGYDALIASFDPAGTRRFARRIGTAGDDRATSVAGGSVGAYAGISVAGPPDLGGLVITGAPNPTGIVLKLEP